MPRVVILEHTLPDGTAHFDWMIEDPSIPGERRLRTFRVSERPDRVAAFAAERIGDHRAVYLSYEGELTGGRGRVRRLAMGDVLEAAWKEDGILLSIHWQNGGILRYDGEIGQQGKWSIRAIGGLPLDGESRL